MVDKRLTNYVEQQVNNGYSLEQIRAYLLQNRYQEKDVTAAIALVEDKLAKSSQISVLAGYAKEYLGQGYTQQQIEQGLLQQGYNPVMVQIALQKAAKKQFTFALPTISKKTLLIIFLALLMTITLVAIAWFFVNIEKSEEQAVDFVIRVDVETLAPGDTLYITNDFKHFPDDREYPITIYYTISDKETLTREDSWQISFDRDDPLERTTKYGLQRNIAENDYEVYAKLNYGSTSVQSYAYFTISLDEDALEDAVEEAVENEHILDETQEKPETEEVIEEGDVTSEVYLDTSDDYKNYAAAKELAGQDAEAAVVYCTAVQDAGQKDSCYNTVARTSEQKEYCADIISDPTKDACYIYFAFNLGDYTVCEMVANEFIQQSCQQLEQVAQLQQ